MLGLSHALKLFVTKQMIAFCREIPFASSVLPSGGNGSHCLNLSYCYLWKAEAMCEFAGPVLIN